MYIASTRSEGSKEYPALAADHVIVVLDTEYGGDAPRGDRICPLIIRRKNVPSGAEDNALRVFVPVTVNR
jgi:hypothetical protein